MPLRSPSCRARLLVTGAAGQLGRRVIHHLLHAAQVAAGDIIATTRKPGSLADLAAQGIEVRRADFDDAAGLATAFAGADRLLLISTDAVERPGQRLAQHTAAIAAATAAGVQHVVYTSMPKPEPGSPIPFAPDHYGTEQALAASTLGWTILRNAWYMENLEHSLPAALAKGYWHSAAGQGRVAYIARDDCARTAAAVLAAPPARTATFDITGAEALTTGEIAALAHAVLGHPLDVVDVAADQLGADLLAAGVAAQMAALFVAFDLNTRAGNLATVTSAVADLTGTPPQSLRDFFLAHRSKFEPA